MIQEIAKISDDLTAIHEETHEALVILLEVRALLAEFGPLLSRFRTPLGAAAAVRQARRGNGG